MKNPHITTLSRVILVVCGLALLIVLVTPIWRIELDAPQYPEGLELLIYADKLAGNVDIINGLNHYIGMKTLHTDDFMEFKVLPGIIVFFAVCCLIVAFIRKAFWLKLLFGLFTAFGILAMIDFWRWEYDYGHNLDPNAAIIVPGMAYQPPLIGFKQLLNFGAYSIPATGGWIFFGVGLALLGLVIYEWKQKILPKGNLKSIAVIFLSLPILVSSCSHDPEPIRVGKDSCSACKMAISDNRFSSELITSKGKIFKFDDSKCLLEFLRAKAGDDANTAKVYFLDFENPEKFIEAEKAFFLQSPSFKSPMNGNIAAFSTEEGIEKALPNYYGNRISWEDMQK